MKKSSVLNWMNSIQLTISLIPIQFHRGGRVQAFDCRKLAAILIFSFPLALLLRSPSGWIFFHSKTILCVCVCYRCDSNASIDDWYFCYWPFAVRCAHRSTNNIGHTIIFDRHVDGWLFSFDVSPIAFGITWEFFASHTYLLVLLWTLELSIVTKTQNKWLFILRLACLLFRSPLCVGVPVYVSAKCRQMETTKDHRLRFHPVGFIVSFKIYFYIFVFRFVFKWKLFAMDDIFHLMVTKQKITEMFCRCHAAAGGILTSTTITITAHDMKNKKIKTDGIILFCFSVPGPASSFVYILSSSLCHIFRFNWILNGNFWIGCIRVPALTL